MNGALSNQTVVVIGGSSGIGAAVAQAAQAEGARVVSISRSGRASAGVEAIAVDIADRGKLEDLFRKVGHIDHLAHTAAARSGNTPLAALEENALPIVFDIKLFRAIHAVRLALPYLAPTASITFTSGQVSRKYGVGSLPKGVVNAAVDTAGRHLAKELAPRRVNVISPGLVNTNLWGEPDSASRSAMIARASSSLPVGRIGAPAELAQAYLFLMTNKFVTGAVLDVDGGGLL